MRVKEPDLSQFSKVRVNLRVTEEAEMMIDELVEAGRILNWSPLFHMTKTAVIMKAIRDAHEKYVELIDHPFGDDAKEEMNKPTAKKKGAPRKSGVK